MGSLGWMIRNNLLHLPLDALLELNSLRGKKNSELVNEELKCIKENIIKSQDIINESSGILKRYLTILCDPTFFKPFGLLIVLFPFALNWTGMDTVSLYFVPILE